MSERVFREWRNRVAAEYRSAALTAQVSHWMIQCGLPDPLLHTSLRIVRDELDHAALSHECLVALGGDDAPASIDVSRLAEPARNGVLADLVSSITRNFCLGETLAVPLFNAMRAGTSHPAAQRVLTRVLKDEAIHRAFGWDALDALIEMDPVGVRSRVSSELPALLEGFEQSYAFAPTLDTLSDEERSMGLLSLADYAEVFWVTARGDISKRYGARGIDVPGTYGPR